MQITQVDSENSFIIEVPLLTCVDNLLFIFEGKCVQNKNTCQAFQTAIINEKYILIIMLPPLILQESNTLSCQRKPYPRERLWRDSCHVVTLYSVPASEKLWQCCYISLHVLVRICAIFAGFNREVFSVSG